LPIYLYSYESFSEGRHGDPPLQGTSVSTGALMGIL